MMSVFFFFQAEDGIRDKLVTGVQTCALPISARWLADPENSRRIAQQVASGLAKTLEALPDEDVQALVRQVVSARLRATRVAPALGKTLAERGSCREIGRAHV